PAASPLRQRGPCPPIHTPSLHDALPICRFRSVQKWCERTAVQMVRGLASQKLNHRGHEVNSFSEMLNLSLVNMSRRSNNQWQMIDRKSTRLNSSHVEISYAVFCLKNKII